MSCNPYLGLSYSILVHGVEEIKNICFLHGAGIQESRGQGWGTKESGCGLLESLGMRCDLLLQGWDCCRKLCLLVLPLSNLNTDPVFCKERNQIGGRGLRELLALWNLSHIHVSPLSPALLGILLSFCGIMASYVLSPCVCQTKSGSCRPIKVCVCLFVPFCFILSPLNQEVTELSRQKNILRLMKGQGENTFSVQGNLCAFSHCLSQLPFQVVNYHPLFYYHGSGVLCS